MGIGSKLKNLKTSMRPTINELKFMILRMRKSPLSIFGGAIVLFYIAIALLAPVLAPPVGRDPFMIPQESFTFTPSPPSPKHPFGTTQQQYDIYYGCIWGTITAFRIGAFVVLGDLIIGLLFGIIGAYYGRIADEILMRFTDIIFAFPFIVFAMALVVALPSMFTLNASLILAIALTLVIALGLVARWHSRLLIVMASVTALFWASAFAFPIMSSARWTNLDKVMTALVLVGWPSYARLIRGEALRVKQEDYVEAAKAIGCSDLRVIIKHILPNCIYPVLIVASLDIGGVVLSAAALSFLGLGAPIGYADWGQMISMSRDWIYGAPWNPYAYWYVFVIPGIFIFTFVLGWNLLGDAFRDVLDPMIRRK